MPRGFASERANALVYMELDVEEDEAVAEEDFPLRRAVEPRARSICVSLNLE
jgi:hypothetical protein